MNKSLIKPYQGRVMVPRNVKTKKTVSANCATPGRGYDKMLKNYEQVLAQPYEQ